MANYTGAQRSNYVRFREDQVQAVDHYLRDFGIEMHESLAHPGCYCLTPYEYSEDGCFVTYAFDEHGQDIELELAWVAQQMEEGQILVVEQVGHEKLRYLSGTADAWNWKGEWVGISIGEIYKRAAEKFDVPEGSISQASY